MIHPQDTIYSQIEQTRKMSRKLWGKTHLAVNGEFICISEIKSAKS